VGWGHSSVTHALQFARRVAARKTLLFHHDPGHTDDELDAMLAEARAHWIAGGGPEDAISMAAEGIRVTVGTSDPAIKS
jgi:phosphoribosyl 1,2-cyclic phosphodiesterase